MRYQRVLAATGVVGLISLGVAAPSQAALTTFCDGNASGVTVPGDLVVRPGDSCDLTDVVVQGNVSVRAGSNLLLDGVTVDGDLVVGSDGFATLVDASVAGVTRLNTAFGLSTDASTHAGVVNANGGFVYSIGSTHGGNVRSTGGETYVESGRLAGNLVTDGDLLTDVHDTVVEGILRVTATTDGTVICASEVDGNAAYADNVGLAQIGAGQVLDCDVNVFGGNLSLTGTMGTSYVDGNVIRGNLTCSDNDPAPVLANNRVRGDDNCEGSAPAAAARSLRTDAADRAAGVRDRIQARTDAGADAANDAGPAFD